MTQQLKPESGEKAAANPKADEGLSLAERIEAIQDEFAKLSKPGGLPADKAFFDDLCGEI